MKKEKSSRNRLRLWAGLLIAVAIFLIIHLIYQKTRLELENNSSPPQSNTPLSVQFDFYTTLPKMSVMTTHSMINDEDSKIFSATEYFLQIAAVRQAAFAKNLSAQMDKQGYHVVIQPYPSGQIIWYRVMLGPFTSIKEAQKKQAQLAISHIDSIIVREPKS